MLNRLVGWWQLGILLAVVWTVMVLASGWMNLPRAHQVAHDSLFLNKLSLEASAILRGTAASTKPFGNAQSARPLAVVWSEQPRTLRMPNGADLAFPSTTTDHRMALVAVEYREVLQAKANALRWQYLLEMAVIWLLPIVLMFVAGLAISLRGSGAPVRIKFANAQSKTHPGATIA